MSVSARTVGAIVRPPSSFTPWLAIPADVYYRYNIFFAAPSMFMSWILAASVVHLLARLFSGAGSFEGTLSVMGFGVSIATWASGIHDFTDAALAALGVINAREYELALNTPTFWRGLLWTLYGIYFIWMTVLFAKGVGASERLRRGPSILLALIGLVVYHGLFAVFNR